MAPPRRHTSDVGELIRERMTSDGRSQQWLATEVAKLLNEPVMTQTAVIKWLRRPENMTPARVFAIEKALGVRPGTWSRELGYLPPEAAAARSVLEALSNDPILNTDPTIAALVKGTYTDAIKLLKQRARRNGTSRTGRDRAPS